MRDFFCVFFPAKKKQKKRGSKKQGKRRKKGKEEILSLLLRHFDARAQFQRLFSFTSRVCGLTSHTQIHVTFVLPSF